MKRMRVLLEWPVLCSIILSTGMIAAHTVDGSRLFGSRADTPEFLIPTTVLTGTQAIKNYCGGCHSSGRSGVDFDDDTLTLEAMRSDPATWKQVLAKLRMRKMPPRGFPQPLEEERELLISWIEQEVLHERYATDKGRWMVRRLQRSEYLSSIRDLLGVAPAANIELPKDEFTWRRSVDIPQVGEHLKSYQAAADAILDQAMAAESEFGNTAVFASSCACLTDTENARDILSRFMRRAFRKVVDADQVERAVAIFEKAEANCDGFPQCMKAALADVLTSPQFLYRIESLDTARDDQFALASRLSFFLWRSGPDDELLSQAEAGTLSANIDCQVRRLTQDPRSNVFAVDFARHWLALGKLTSPSESDVGLTNAMTQETEHFVAHIVRENRSVLEFLDSDYTFLNEPLASHYGIAGVSGAAMRRVEHRESNRGGLLGHASILSVTSPYATTSPIVRGKWVMENLLGAPPIKPPPGVLEAFQSAPRKSAGGSQRELMEVHRQNPSCAQCHTQLDAIGLVLERFDHRGEVRSKLDSQPIDGIGALSDGTLLQSPRELRAYLMKQRETFLTGLRGRLLEFALKRKVNDGDRAALRVSSNAGPESYRMSQVILDVVRSAPFQQGWREEP